MTVVGRAGYRQVASGAGAPCPRSAAKPRSWSGRCPSYGDGVTYRPLAEIVRQIGGDDPRARIEELLDADERAAGLVLSAIGLSEAPAQAEETFWAVRSLLERAGRRSCPLVVVVEDVHWAEPSAAGPARLPRGLLERAPDPAHLPRPARVRARCGRPGWRR